MKKLPLIAILSMITLGSCVSKKKYVALESDLNDTKSKIYDKKPKTITLSCGRWNTGSTVKQWNSVWMLDDGYSAENWFQTVMRSGSPWISNSGEFLKEKVHVVDFNSDRMLKCYIEYSTVVSKYIGYEPSEFATQMLNCMPIFSVDISKIRTFIFFTTIFLLSLFLILQFTLSSDITLKSNFFLDLYFLRMA